MSANSEQAINQVKDIAKRIVLAEIDTLAGLHLAGKQDELVEAVASMSQEVLCGFIFALVETRAEEIASERKGGDK